MSIGANSRRSSVRPRFDLAMLDTLDAWIKAEGARCSALAAVQAARSVVAEEHARFVLKRATSRAVAAQSAMHELVALEAESRS